MIRTALSLILVASAAFAEDARQAIASERPLFRVGIMTDTHVEDDPASTNRLAAAYRLFRAQGVRLIANCGDIADYWSPKAYANYRAVRAATYPDAATAPRELYAWAGHDHFRFPDQQEPEPWANAFASVRRELGIPHDMYADEEIGGFRFLVVPQKPDYGRYRQMLEKACAESPDKPVFVIDHIPPAGTTEGTSSADCGDPRRRLLLAEFPQAIVFTGHSHTSLHNERNIWQGEFTTISAGGLSIWSGDFLGEVLWPMMDRYDVLVMEVFGRKAVLRRYDVRTGREFGGEAPWTVRWPYDPARPDYPVESRRAKAMVPSFPADAGIDLRETPSGRPFAVTVSFPASVSTNSIRSYRIAWERPDAACGWRTFARQEVPGEFGCAPEGWPSRIEYAFTGAYFEPGESYRVSVRPVNAWGQEGAAIVRTWTAPRFGRHVAWSGLPDGVTSGQRFVIGRGDESEIRLNLPEALKASVLTPGARVRVAIDLETEQHEESGVTFSLFGNANRGRYPWCLTTPLGACDARYAFDVTLPKKEQSYSLAFRHGVSGWFSVKGVRIERLPQP